MWMKITRRRHVCVVKLAPAWGTNDPDINKSNHYQNDDLRCQIEKAREKRGQVMLNSNQVALSKHVQNYVEVEVDKQ